MGPAPCPHLSHSAIPHLFLHEHPLSSQTPPLCFLEDQPAQRPPPLTRAPHPCMAPSHCSHPCTARPACVPHCSTGMQLQTFGQGPLFLIESLLWAGSGWMKDGRMDEWVVMEG